MDKYVGMTVNERLYVSGLMGEFDKAVKNKNTESIVSILKEVELTEESITDILLSLRLTINE